MEQQADLFTQKRFELIVEMATKKLQQEIAALKDQVFALNSEIGSVKSQMNRLQFQPQRQNSSPQVQQSNYAESQPQKKIDIVDCRPADERKNEFVSGASRNSEPVKPRYGDYRPEDVSVDKFFYFGRK